MSTQQWSKISMPSWICHPGVGRAWKHNGFTATWLKGLVVAQLKFGSFHLLLDMPLLQVHIAGMASDGERVSLDTRTAGFKPYVPA